MPQNFRPCPACEKKWHDVARRGERPSACSCGHSFVEPPHPSRSQTHNIRIIGKEWGHEGKSLRFAFDPKARPDIAKTCPTLAKAIADDGSVMFENDKQQKRIYGEMAAEKATIEATRANEVEQNLDVFLGDGSGGGDGGDDESSENQTSAAPEAVTAE